MPTKVHTLAEEIRALAAGFVSALNDVPPRRDDLARICHSLKALAALAGHEDVSAVAHAAEDVLAQPSLQRQLQGVALLFSDYAELRARGSAEDQVLPPGIAARARAALDHMWRPPDRSGIDENTAGLGAARGAWATLLSLYGMRVSEAHSRGERVYRLVVTVDETAEMALLKVELALQRVAEVADVVATSPAIEVLASGSSLPPVDVLLIGGSAVAIQEACRIDRLEVEVSEVAKPQFPDSADRAEEPLPWSAVWHALRAAQPELARPLYRYLRDHWTVPLSDIASRLARGTTQLADGLGKQVQVHLDGAPGRIEAGLAAALTEPLLHLVRNAVTHGIETPEERAAAGKGALGAVRITTVLDGHTLEVSVSDDGRGVDRAAVRARLASVGMQAPLDTDEQLLQALATPGVSTAPEVSALAGRGVGLDVVRAHVAGRLRGSMQLRSCNGAGATFTLRVPALLCCLPVVDDLTGPEGTLSIPPPDGGRHTREALVAGGVAILDDLRQVTLAVRA